MNNDNYNNYNGNNYYNYNNGVNVNKTETNGFAIAGFVCSFLIPLLGLILSIVGLNKSSVLNDGKGLSIAGIVISSIFMFFSLIVILIVWLGMIFATGTLYY